MKNRKTVMTLTVLTIGIVLLGKNIKLNNTISVKDTEIEILQSKNKSLEIELESYRSIINAVNNIDTQKSNYTYYPIENLTIEEQEYIYDIATNNNFSFELILALLKVESNFQKDIISITDDWGISQIHRPYAPYYATLANLDEYDLLDFRDNIILSVTNLITCRNYWLNQYPDISDEVLVYYILGSYNCGVSGFADYLNQTGTYITDYAEIVLNYKCELEQQIN